MRQFDVYENPVPEARGFAPYLVVLSSHLLLDFDDAVVAPLVNDAQHTVSALELEVEGEALVVVISDLSAIEGRELRRYVGTMKDREFDIRRALDRLFTGF